MIDLDDLASTVFDTRPIPPPPPSRRQCPSELQFAVLVALAEGGPLPTCELKRTISAMRDRGWVQVTRTGRPRLMPAGRNAYRIEWRQRADALHKADPEER